MSDFSLKDDDLSALEAQLLGQSPKLDPVGQQLLIYRCAFDAGKRAGTKTLRIWQSGAVFLAVVFGATQLPWTRPAPSLQPPTQTASNLKEEPPLGVAGVLPTPNFAKEMRKSLEDRDELFEREIQKFARLDPKEKAHALIRFSQAEDFNY